MLASSPNRAVTTAAMKMVKTLIRSCSTNVVLTLVRANLIPKLILALNPPSLSFTQAVDIHINLMATMSQSVWLATPDGLAELGIQDRNERHTVHETVLQQVLAPSEEYIHHLCLNRYSIVNGEQSTRFMAILAKLPMFLQSHQPAMNFIIQKAVVLTIPSCMTFFEVDEPNWRFFAFLIGLLEEWNEQGGDVRRSGTKMFRSFRMEGIEDVTEQRLRNEETEDHGRNIVDYSKLVSSLLGVNIAELE
ncbi:hypothetical protein BLNAU_5458 [Blattamonas nauphoetae]|uniref:Uncharacterized protein n=1 Tax=Blattamonas nauphoetae TaxID=2049346 RepID=A0ABQ9Y7D3_9EUKA|nr:hypothetical protein BLNAU_5458 [Blattamonas nauphoetae]